jgi:phospholipase C
MAASRSLDQIEHVILFMQENRPFDHYFGTLKGVRGFNDRTPPMLKTGRDSFWQPIDVNNPDAYMLPFRTVANETNTMCMPAPEMYYPTDIQMYNGGRVDGWNTARDPGYGMAYFTREDLPYYYTLYDNFLVGDQYFQSTFTNTNPNRMHFFTGTSGLSVDNNTCVLDNTEPLEGYSWITAAEVLQNSGISWKVYQNVDNFDDNAFAWFHNFRTAKQGDPLREQGMKRYPNLFLELEKDMQAGTLPKVSWVIAPTRKSEHATNHPCAGEDFTARLLELLQKHPKIYAKTLFVLNYDEGGQFFDHAVPYTPPLNAESGFSSVTTEGEINTITMTTEPNPIGLGFRVPIALISPWTRGSLVYSEVMDHTSILQFMEEWLSVTFPTISPWRRLVTGNLVSAFDFAYPDYSWPKDLPDTSEYVKEGDIECHTLPAPIIPTEQAMPVQEVGTRRSRALPYQIHVQDQLQVSTDSKEFTLDVSITNTGSEGIPMVFYDIQHIADVTPRQIALSPDSSFTYHDQSIHTAEGYAAALLGPNGFLREFRGNVATSEVCAAVTVDLQYRPSTEKITVVLKNTHASLPVSGSLMDPVYELFASQSFVVDAQSTWSFDIATTSSGNWYDVVVSLSPSAATPPGSIDTSCLYRRFMGRMETGKDTISDPAMAVGKENWIRLLAAPGVYDAPNALKPLPPQITRAVHHAPSHAASHDKDAKFYSKDYTSPEDHIEL